MTALAAYEAGLPIGGGCWVSWRGSRLPLPVQRWLEDADAAGLAPLVLDSTCGRHVAGLGSARP
jgi:hypothetical protein